MLTEQQKSDLLKLAWKSIEAQVAGRREPLTLESELPDSSGAFVTIKRRGELRGCLGTLRCSRGLAREVARCAADAASEDPRFPPVSPDEIPELSIEVSVLGPLEVIDPRDSSAIVIGRHGLVAEQDSSRGLLLPQVATEWGWTVEQFLRHTCIKAGLRGDAWQHGATIYRFDAEVFGD